MISVSGEQSFSVSRGRKLTAKTKYDFDFTKINYYVASGIIFDFMIKPEKYVNKTVKIKGQFLSDVYEGKRLLAVVLWDLGGCCPSGLTVVPIEEMKYPSDFPVSGNYATFFGTLEMVNLMGEEDSLCLVVEKWE